MVDARNDEERYQRVNSIVTQLTRPAIRVIFYTFSSASTGELIPDENFDMAIQPSNTNLLLLCPLVIEHVIDQSSPLYPISPHRLYNFDGHGPNAFEIVVIIEGTMESTGDACQYRTSYKPREILWGFRFKQTHFTYEQDKIKFDMLTFEEFEPVNMDGYVVQGRGPKIFVPELTNSIHQERKRKRRHAKENNSPVRVNA